MFCDLWQCATGSKSSLIMHKKLVHSVWPSEKPKVGQPSKGPLLPIANEEISCVINESKTKHSVSNENEMPESNLSKIFVQKGSTKRKTSPKMSNENKGGQNTNPRNIAKIMNQFQRR